MFGKLIITVFSSLLLSIGANAATAANGAYDIDLDHSSVSFNVSHAGLGLVAGRFNQFSGSFQFNANGTSSANVTIDVASVDTNQAQRDNHLRSDDFFDTQQFPRMKFASTQVAYDQDGHPAKIIGNLTLLGTTKPVTLVVTTNGFGKGPRGATRVGFTATTSIKRTDFGMSEFLAAASDDVTITIQIEGIRK